MTATATTTELNKYFMVGKYYGQFFLETEKAPSIADLEEVSGKNEGDLTILDETEAEKLLNQLVRHVGDPKYKHKEIEHLRQNIDFSCKNGYLDDETGAEFLEDLDKGFAWLNQPTPYDN